VAGARDLSAACPGHEGRAVRQDTFNDLVALTRRTNRTPVEEHTSSSTADDFFGSGNPSAEFPHPRHPPSPAASPAVGDPMQQKDYATGTPKVWDDGNPMMQLPVDLATDQRDPDIADDDGTRTLYIKGQLRKAIGEALRKSGAKGLAVGGTLSVTYARDGEPAKKGFNAPKEYEATYTLPSATFLAGRPGPRSRCSSTGHPGCRQGRADQRSQAAHRRRAYRRRHRSQQRPRPGRYRSPAQRRRVI